MILIDCGHHVNALVDLDIEVTSKHFLSRDEVNECIQIISQDLAKSDGETRKSQQCYSREK